MSEPLLLSGSGSPNGSVFGSPGDLYTNLAGGAGTTFWVKESGVETDTGWTALPGVPCQAFLYKATGAEGSSFVVPLPVPQTPPYLVYAQLEGTHPAATFIIDVPFAGQTATDFQVTVRNDGTPAANDLIAFQVCAPTAAIAAGPAPLVSGATQVPPSPTPRFTFEPFALGGDHVLVTGAGFLTATAVHVNGVSTPFAVIDDTHMNVGPLPAQPSGPATITVTNPDGTSAPQSVFAYSHWRPIKRQGPSPLVTGQLERDKHCVVQLNNGLLLFFGGNSNGSSPDDHQTFLFDPSTLTYTQAASMNALRDTPGAALLSDGRVLCCGGFDPGTGLFVNTAEVYDPGADTWTLVGNMSVERGQLAVVTLTNGLTLVIGGETNAGAATTSELFDPGTNTFGGVATIDAGFPTRNAPAVTVAGGDVLSISGNFGESFGQIFRYSPGTNSWTTKTAMPFPRAQVAAAVLPSGKVLVIGGFDESAGGNPPTTQADIYDPAGDAWIVTSPISEAVGGTQAVVLSSGLVYRMGGLVDEAGTTRGFKTETYDEGSGTWTAGDDRHLGTVMVIDVVVPQLAVKLSASDVVFVLSGDDGGGFPPIGALEQFRS